MSHLFVPFALIFLLMSLGCDVKPASPIPASKGCSKTTDCGEASTGAMCFVDKCLTWEVKQEGISLGERYTWNNAFEYCNAKKTVAEPWRLPTKQELKYLCRGDSNFPDRTTDRCGYAIEITAGWSNRTIWSSTCVNRWNDNDSRESSDSAPCKDPYWAWAVNISNGESLPIKGNQARNVICVHD
jgi:hypothetical protein